MVNLLAFFYFWVSCLIVSVDLILAFIAREEGKNDSSRETCFSCVLSVSSAYKKELS